MVSPDIIIPIMIITTAMTNNLPIETIEDHARMTDLHCHLLPGLDDGAQDAAASIELLKLEYDSGIRQIALTSHFDGEKISISDFLKLRQASYIKMKQAMANSGYTWNDLNLKLGAEVLFSPNLCAIEPEKLCIQDTPFMLLELPTEIMPSYFKETIYQLQARGITPIIAHIERYSYVMKDLPILCDWVDQGIYIQINARTILNNGSQAKLCLNLLKWNLCHVVASDAHSVHKRPPNLNAGLDAVSNRLGQSTANQLIRDADLIFNGNDPIAKKMHYPKKILGRWW